MNERMLFILRRAFWVGRVKRADLMRAFGVSGNQASLDLKKAAETTWRQYLKRDGVDGRMGLVPLPGLPNPPEASADKLLRLLELRRPAAETGLFEDELNPIVEGNYVFRPSDAVTENLIKANIKHYPIEILYSGLAVNQSARWRRVLPMSLEFNGRQWRLIAEDLDDASAEWGKTFVLSRIHDARPVWGGRKTQYQAKLNILPVRYRVTLNDRLTRDQRSAISRELGIDNGLMALCERDEYEFRRLYCDQREGVSHIVWPLITHLEKESR